MYVVINSYILNKNIGQGIENTSQPIEGEESEVGVSPGIIEQGNLINKTRLTTAIEEGNREDRQRAAIDKAIQDIENKRNDPRFESAFKKAKESFPSLKRENLVWDENANEWKIITIPEN